MFFDRMATIPYGDTSKLMEMGNGSVEESYLAL